MKLEELIYIHNAYQELMHQADRIQQNLNAREGQGLVSAKPYWIRKNDPHKPDQLELTHSTHSDYYKQYGTRREYIGVKPKRIKAVLDGINRYHQYVELKSEAREIERKIRLINIGFENLRMNIFAQQSRF